MVPKALRELLPFANQMSLLGTVAYAYNPSYSGGRDQEDHR
jgi:hypothetical protein